MNESQLLKENLLIGLEQHRLHKEALLTALGEYKLQEEDSLTVCVALDLHVEGHCIRHLEEGFPQPVKNQQSAEEDWIIIIYVNNMISFKLDHSFVFNEYSYSCNMCKQGF